jgi:hypothetical protein
VLVGLLAMGVIVGSATVVINKADKPALAVEVKGVPGREGELHGTVFP